MFRKLFVMMLGLALLGGFTVAEAGTLTLRVDTHGFADFDVTDNGILQDGAAFYVSGDICAELVLLGDCTPIGTFHCWGWLVGPTQEVALVSQEFDIDGRGKIQVQGVEDDGPRAIVGGTGQFRNVRGEATGFDLSEFMGTGQGEFIATFELIGR
jgi:hypothetical protein